MRDKPFEIKITIIGKDLHDFKKLLQFGGWEGQLFDVERQITEQTNPETTIYQQAINKWGRESQIKKIQEEALELALVINNFDCPTKNKEVAYKNFISEVADVTIMLRQAEIMIGKQTLKNEIEKKLQKLNSFL